MKKGQSISINTIVVAVIALMVLIVVIFIFSRQSGIFVDEANSCAAVNGICYDDCGNDKVQHALANKWCKDNKQKEFCCVDPLQYSNNETP